MPRYKSMFEDAVPEDQAFSEMKSAFSDTVPETGEEEEGITYLAKGTTRAATNFEMLFPGITELKKDHPNLYGFVAGTVETFRDVGDFAVDIIPTLKYARPADRASFLQLSPVNQSVAILHETLGAELWAMAGRPLEAMGLLSGVVKAPFKAVGLTGHAMKRAAEPVVDAAAKLWKPYSRQDSFSKFAKKKGASPARAQQASEYIFGETTAVNAEAKILAKEFLVEELTQAHTARSFGSHMGKTAGETKDLFKKWAEKRFGKKAKEAKLDDAADHVVEEFTRWYITASPESFAKMGTKVGDKVGKDLWGFVHLYPIRFILGAGEKSYGTFTNVYRRIQSATKLKNKALTDNIILFHKGLEQVGLGKFKSGKFTPAAALTTGAKDQAYAIINKFDDLMESARQGKITMESAKKQIAESMNKASKDFPVARRLVDAWSEFSDHLYAQHTLWKMTSILEDAGLTAVGANRLALFMKNEAQPIMQDLFSARNGINATDKILGIEKLLKSLSQGAKTEGMFSRSGTNVETALSRLQYGADDGIMPYLEHYSMRFLKNDRRIEDISFKLMASKKNPFYTQPRTLAQALGRADDFDSMIYIRTHSQAKEMFYNKTLGEVAEFTNKLPDDYKSYISHYLARLHNIPSAADKVVADVLTKALPIGSVSPRDLYKATQVLNDLTYMGILGFKPFSAMRNLFQVPLMVPAELGHGFFKGWKQIAKGYGDLKNPTVISYLNSIGVITDYAPELMKMSGLFKMPKSFKVGGKVLSIPRMEQIRDAAMFMFSGADRVNRYVSGAAALRQWDEGLAALITKDVAGIMKATGANKRPAWIQSEIRDMLSRGQVDKAKAVFVTDVVGNSQYLYGPLDAPLITQVGGSLGRQANVFQSWWMNYGAAIEQWIKTGRGPGGAQERMLSWAMSSFVIYVAMSGIWGKGTAKRSTFLGPFSNVTGFVGDPFNSIARVPAWRPVVEGAKMAMRAGELLTNTIAKNREKLERQGLALVKSGANFFPGGNISMNVSKKLFQKGQPGLMPTGYELESGVKEFFGRRSF